MDDGSTDATAERARGAGATVVRHPYNKGNGAAVKTGIRRATGEYVLIVDGDGQHQAADARAAGRRTSASTTSSSARGRPDTQATHARLLGNAVLNWLASYLTRPRRSRTSRPASAARAGRCLREFLHLLPNGFSTPTTTTLAFIKAGYNVRFEPIEADARVGQSKIRLVRDGVKFLLIVLKIVTIFSPLRVFLPISLASFLLGAGYAAVDHRHAVPRSPTRRCC